ncbi:MAG: DUF2000 family protein [Chloroflexi bacterium]|nr:DUF2000 family protein [Chloroflexota bacterium]
MQFDTKIAVVIRSDLPTWQKLNVTAFTVSGIASLEDVIGEPYVDGSERTYLPMIKQPILIFGADREQLRGVYEQALEKDVQLSIYTEELFSTPHDEANRAAVRAYASSDLNLVGVALRGRKKIMDKLLKGLSLHT